MSAGRCEQETPTPWQAFRRRIAWKLAEWTERSASPQALAHYTEDHAEAIHALIEKRRPVFHGR